MARPFAVVGFAMLFPLAVLFFLPEVAVIPALALFALGLLGSLFLRLRRKLSGRAPGSSAVPVACGAALLACLLLWIQLTRQYYPALACVGDDLQIRATVTDTAEHRYGRYYYQIRTQSVNGVSTEVKLRLSTRVPIYAEPYDTVAYTGRIFRLGGEDPESVRLSRAQGVWLGSDSSNFGEDPVEVFPAAKRPPTALLFRLREIIQSTLTRRFPGEPGALLRGMLLGDTGILSRQAANDFRSAGASHIFSVSGLHVSLLGYAAFQLFLFLRVPRRLSSILGGGFVVWYMALTGFSPSCVRAGLMMLLVLAGECFALQADSLNSMGLAAAALMTASPLSAGQLGLELSFGAAIGIVVFLPRLQTVIRRRTRCLKARPRRILRSLLGAGSVSVCALSLVVPISLLRLPGGTSLITPISNLVLVPLAELTLLLGGLAIPFGGLPLVGKPLTLCVDALSRAMLWLAKFFAALPLPQLRDAGGWTAGGLALCFLVLAAALFLLAAGKPPRTRVVALACAGILALGCWGPDLLRPNDTRLRLLDTGGGVAVLLTKGRQTALLGCGNGPLAFSAIDRDLAALHITRLDFLLLPTRPLTPDGSRRDLLREIPIAQILTVQTDEVLARMDAQTVLVESAAAQLSFWPGATGTFRCTGYTAGCFLELDNLRVLVLFSGVTDMDLLPEAWHSADILICLARPPDALAAQPFRAVLAASAPELAPANWAALERLPPQTMKAMTGGGGSLELRIRPNGTFTVRRVS
ncbi:MAG: ComEC/Rec2 family competence protein [Oscillospiraceae bacterium]|jgi:competence protein ComEC|nr:ComEC/Rec2 family competence protein [Oscillospiraceae bacterium]